MVCPICLNQEAQERSHPTRDAQRVACQKCGDFTISRRAIVNLNSVPVEERWRVSAWVREYLPSVVTTVDVEVALKARVPGLLHRGDRMLRALHQRCPQGFAFSHLEIIGTLISVGWNRNAGEVRFMIEEVLLKELAYLSEPVSKTYQISAKGLLHLEGRPNENSPTGFCAMWFNDEVLPLWTQAIEPAIRLSSYSPLKIDIKPHNNKIDDEIVASIRAARFVVADCTNNRGGVYYEAGFAHGLGLPVIFMCRYGEQLHFDVRQYNCIFWNADQLEEAQARLQNRILATLGQGPLKVK